MIGLTRPGILIIALASIRAASGQSLDILNSQTTLQSTQLSRSISKPLDDSHLTSKLNEQEVRSAELKDPKWDLGGPAPDAAEKKTAQFPTAKLEGLIQADLGYFTQDAASIANVGDLLDGSDFRRVRLGVKGNVSEATSYLVEVDFAALDRVAFTDVFVNVKRNNINFRFGRWRQPFGMSALTSVKELTFIERTSTFGFVPFRQTGAGAFGTYGDQIGTWALSGFRTESDLIGASLGDDGGWGLAGRLTRLLIDNKPCEQILHVGFDYSFIGPTDNTLAFASRPEAFIAEFDVGRIPDFVATGEIATQGTNLFAVEGGFKRGRLHGQSEIFLVTLDQIAGSPLAFQGAYAQVAYSLTGETRPYNYAAGVFGRPNVDSAFDVGGIGAWEIAARWSYIDLSDENISGGRLTTLTAGLNCYLNNRFKCQFNYINAMTDDLAAPDSNTNLFVGRLQLDF